MDNSNQSNVKEWATRELAELLAPLLMLTSPKSIRRNIKAVALSMLAMAMFDKWMNGYILGSETYSSKFFELLHLAIIMLVIALSIMTVDSMTFWKKLSDIKHE